MRLSEIILPIIKDAAKIMLSAHVADGAVISKTGDANFVTEYDKRTQDFLIEKISGALPDATFVAEEQDNDFSVTNSALAFVIDPIDGTTNFIHGFSHSSISVACLSYGKTVFGAVYNPYLDEMYSAEVGHGAYKNERHIAVSERAVGSGLLLFGSSPYYKNELSESGFATAYRIFRECADVRRLASAALDLCYVAEGRAEMFFEFRLSPWDFLAGELILREAGGTVTDIAGEVLPHDRVSSVVAANAACYKRLLSLVRGEY